MPWGPMRSSNSGVPFAAQNVRLANNVLKAARYGTGSLTARMLFGEALTNF